MTGETPPTVRARPEFRDPDPATLDLLEWGRILEALAVRTATPGGARAARALPWAPDAAEVERSLGEIAEAVALEREGAVPDLGGAADLRQPAARLEIGAVLEDDELLAFARTIRIAAAARRSLRAHRDLAPLLAARAERIPDLEETAAEILDAYTPSGELADHASPELKRIRGETAATRSRILALMEDQQARFAEVLQDRFTTLRDERFVLPVRADAHQKLPGIVHGASHSGATLFVEPEPVVPLANRLRVTLAAVEREQARIRARFTGILRARREEIAAADDGLAGVDLKLAAGTLARNLDLHPPCLRAAPGLRLLAARHPILMLTGREVVPGDITLEPGRGLLISGPNSGGKTVALKTAALCALMLRAGLPLPASPDSEAGLFGSVLADMGDHQSLDLSLSTFSARMVALARILAEARRGDLVALDEVCAGTDPEEGAALAAAVLEALVGRGVAVIGTTHFPALKEMALRDPRLENASVGYDPETLAPTFRLVTGTPGPSAALEVAGRCGVPAEVVATARARVPEGRLALSGSARRIHAEEHRAETARRMAETRLREVEAARTEAAREIEAGRQIGRRKAQQEARELLEAVKRARRQVADAEARFRKPRLRRRDLAKARATLAGAAVAVSPGSPVAGALAPPPPATRTAASEDLRPGTRVWYTVWNREATVLEAPARGKVGIAAGPMRLTAREEDLRIFVPSGSAAPRGARRVPDPGLEAEDPVQTPENCVDLRGLQAGEAIEAVDRFLDRLLQTGRSAGFLIHGHGTGTLRQAVRRHLTGSSYVLRHRPGGAGEGGDGVTVVWIK